LLPKTVMADSVTTSVTVGNSAPAITAGPAESTESSSTSPTNVGSGVTFTATATDSNSENYYLLVCATDAATPTNGGAPNCTSTQWCVSSSTASGAQATCTYTTLIGNAESNAWYAFVCDGNASAANCSAAGNQGTGGTGSPFGVNHAPGFTAISNDGPKDPGATVTWSTTASDTDTSGAADTVKLLVCKTTGIAAGACDGGGSDTWCSSSLGASNPTCGYAVPSVTPDQAYASYVYVVDSHNFGSASANQASNDAHTVNNVAPVVSAVTLNAGAAMDLTEGTTTGVVLGATVTDSNSCYGSELTAIYGYAYRSGKAYALCDTAGEADSNFCYPEVTCTVTGGTCTDATDASANYTCTVNIQYYADPTDASTLYPTENWLDTVKAIDDDTSSHALEVTSGVEMNSLTALDVSSSIAFGNLNVGGKNDPLDKTTTVTPTGNVGLDTELSGAVNMCTDYPTCSGGTIGVSYIKYALAATTAYASSTALSVSATEAELNVPKATSGSPTTKNIWWGIEIPSGTIPGVYSGANTVGAYKGETVGW
ncbi:MAG: hypothetical protein AAB778_02845, partial [Patescibacteria group bacterium]